MALCFRDQTWCASDCTNARCSRHFGPAQRIAARAWWHHDPDRAPVSFEDFSNDCPDYRPPSAQPGELRA